MRSAPGDIFKRARRGGEGGGRRRRTVRLSLCVEVRQVQKRARFGVDSLPASTLNGAYQGDRPHIPLVQAAPPRPNPKPSLRQ
eukprot:scaffold1318_cov388-Prasinococcus_capsulatus_cf.AAC.77